MNKAKKIIRFPFFIMLVISYFIVSPLFWAFSNEYDTIREAFKDLYNMAYEICFDVDLDNGKNDYY